MRRKHGYIGALAALAAATLALHATPAGGGISGTVTYDGTPPKGKPIDMSKEPTCAKQHSSPLTTETVVTGSNNSLENVVVYISAGAPDESAPSQPAKLVQKGCQYLPHVLALEVNQTLEITNEDQTSHNIHPLARVNREWNKSQPAGAPPIEEKYDKAEFISVKCNVHPWMRGTFAVVRNSHYAVTDSSGQFKLPNLPPGKYTLTAWHESFGDQTQDVTIASGDSKTVNFVLKVKSY